jgi:hypothetical protein
MIVDNLTPCWRPAQGLLPMEFEAIDAKMPHHIPLQCTPWTQACSVLPG